MKEVSREEFYSSPFFIKEENIELTTVGDYPYTSEYIVKGSRNVRARSVDYFDEPARPWPVLTKYYIA